MRTAAGAFFLLCLLLPQKQIAAGVLSGPVSSALLFVDVEDYLTLPASSVSEPHARLNFMRSAPDQSGRVFVNDLRGPLYVIAPGVLQTYLDLATLRPNLKTSPGLASGFVSFAFHPEFAGNGKFYTVHSEFIDTTSPSIEPPLPISAIQHSIVTEWTASDASANIFSGTSRELIRIPAPHRFHNIGEVAFNPFANPGSPDFGLLYISLGDFGAVETGQPEQLRRLDSPYGTLMRIDPLGGDGSDYSYAIPAANPHAGSSDPDTLQELIATGFRNPHRLTWHAGTGEVLIYDIGQDNLEEINILILDGDYGWPIREGTYALDPLVDPGTVMPLPANDSSFGFIYPAAQYDHEEGSAIAGGISISGVQSALHEELIFGDIVSGRLFHASLAEISGNDVSNPAAIVEITELAMLKSGVPTTLLQIVRDELNDQSINRVDLRFAEDGVGNYFIMTKQDGVIRRLVLPQAMQVPVMNTVFSILLALLLIGSAIILKQFRGHNT